MRNNKKLSPKVWVSIALILCLISMIGASMFQTSGGKVRIKDLTWESSAGNQLSALLLIPENATKDSPAPGIVTIEGWFNNKEMQDSYWVELARRGYVVLAFDMHGHGDSEATHLDELYDDAVGVNSAVEMLASLPYVDLKKIGLTGHSSGGAAINMAVAIDNEREVPLIATALFQAATLWDDTGVNHAGTYGNRSVGMIADKYDEFFFWGSNDDGSASSAPRDFIGTDMSKEFLNFDEDAADFAGVPIPGKYYERKIDGKTAYRVIYTPSMIHPWVTFSSTCVGYAIDYFQTIFGAPKPITSKNQIWQWKTVFNTIGIVGFLLFLFNFALVLLDLKFFTDLKAKEEVKALSEPKGSGKFWFWGFLLIGALFSGFSFRYFIKTIYSKSTNVFPQSGPYLIGVWTAACGIFGLILLLVFYYGYQKKRGFNIEDRGIRISLKNLGKTVLLALISVSGAFTIIFIADYFFKTDFRLWLLTFKAFSADKVLIALRFLPLFSIFYIFNSVSVNSFNYNTIGKKPWINLVILGLANSIGPIVILLIQYGTFIGTGFLRWYATEGDRISGIWLMPVVLYLFGSVFFTRYIYKKTNNPYLGGLINAMFITMITVTNTFTLLGINTLVAANY